MILNAWTIASLFLSGLAACLALALALVSMRALGRRRIDRGLEAEEDSLHLVGLLVAVLIGVRFLAWPLFYGLLESFVPEFAASGVMCAFGVTQLDATLVQTIEWIKPSTLLGLGAWCSLSLVGRRSGADRLTRPLLVLALPLALLVLADGGVEMTYVLGERSTAPVTCCSQLIDTEPAGSSASPGTLTALGPRSPSAQLGLYAFSNLILLAVLRLALKKGPDGTNVRPGTGIVALAAVLGGANLVVAYGVWVDTIAPIVLQLPYHHCIYEVLTEVPVMAFAAVLTVFGNGALTWPVFLALWMQRAPVETAGVQRSIYRLCAVALASAALIALIHAL